MFPSEMKSYMWEKNCENQRKEKAIADFGFNSQN